MMELLITLAIVAIIGSITLPKISMSRFRADGAMRVVQAVLQQAERDAVQRQMDVIVSFDTVCEPARPDGPMTRMATTSSTLAKRRIGNRWKRGASSPPLRLG